MKLAEAPEPVQRALRAFRRDRKHVAPIDGMLWFGAGLCGMCGASGTNCRDHCHISGLHRGWLCHTCNVAEGVGSSQQVAWGWWRRYAPRLIERERHDRWREAALMPHVVDTVNSIPRLIETQWFDVSGWVRPGYEAEWLLSRGEDVVVGWMFPYADWYADRLRSERDRLTDDVAILTERLAMSDAFFRRRGELRAERGAA